MAPCLVAVLALSGAARSGASPREAHSSTQKISATVTSPTPPRTSNSAATSVQPQLFDTKPRIASPYVYGNGDLHTLPASLTGSSQAVVSSVDLGLPSDSKIIEVPQLQLPPTSKPLPSWMQKATVSADEPNINQAALIERDSKGTLERLAQLPSTKPAIEDNAASGTNPVTKGSSAPAKLPNQITVAASIYVVLMADTDLRTVAIADPSVADVSVINARAVLVNGKSTGSTTLVIADKIGKIRPYDVKVTPAPGARPEDNENAIHVNGVRVLVLSPGQRLPK